MIDPITALALLVAFGAFLLIVVWIGERHDERTAKAWKQIYDQDHS